MGRERQGALPDPSTRLAEEGAEALLLRGVGVILGRKTSKCLVGVTPNQEGGGLPDPSRCLLSSPRVRRGVVRLEQQ